jgi:hypothetical protein
LAQIVPNNRVYKEINLPEVPSRKIVQGENLREVGFIKPLCLCGNKN